MDISEFQARPKFSPKHIYLAGPFFNEAQIALMSEVEHLVETKSRLEFYSPRLHATPFQPSTRGKDTGADPGRTFADNLSAIAQAYFVLVCLDYSMGHLQQLRVIQLRDQIPGSPRPVVIEPDGLPYEYVTTSGTLNLPDTGSVWEIGYAFGTGIPVVGFTMHQPNTVPVNLMLAMALEGTIHGKADLEKFLTLQEPGLPKDWAAYKPTRTNWREFVNPSVLHLHGKDSKLL